MKSSALLPFEADPVPARQWLLSGLRLLGRPLPDRAFLRLAHRLYYHRWPHYDAPRTLQEHIQAYVLRNRDPALVMLADKLAVRGYIDSVLGAGYTVPLIGAWEQAADVPLALLPYPLVLKPSHMSGRVLLLASHQAALESKRRARLASWLRRDHSRINREWFYARIPRRILAEPLLRSPDGGAPPDVKAYVIGGCVRYFQVDRGRFERATRNLYDVGWQLLPVRTSLPRHASEPRPQQLPQLIELAERVAARFEFLRVDFYLLDGKILIGELTSSPGGGFGRFYPASFGEQMAAYWTRLPQRGDRVTDASCESSAALRLEADRPGSLR